MLTPSGSTQMHPSPALLAMMQRGPNHSTPLPDVEMGEMPGLHNTDGTVYRFAVPGEPKQGAARALPELIQPKVQGIINENVLWSLDFDLAIRLQNSIDRARIDLGFGPHQPMFVKIGGHNEFNNLKNCVEGPDRYPRDFYEHYTIVIVSGCPTKIGAEFEEKAMALVDESENDAMAVNVRRKVPEIEHMVGPAPGPKSLVYLKIIKADISLKCCGEGGGVDAGALAKFRELWAKRPNNPHYLLHERKDAYSMGTDAYSQGTDAYSQGTDAFSQGTDAWSTGSARHVPRVAKGIEKKTRVVPNGETGDMILLKHLYTEFESNSCELNDAFNKKSHQKLTRIVVALGPRSWAQASWCKGPRFLRMQAAYDPPWPK